MPSGNVYIQTLAVASYTVGMSTATQELLRLCKLLPEAKLVEATDFVRSLLGQPEATQTEDAMDAPLSDDDIAMMKRSMKDIDEGRWTEASVFLNDMRAKLLAMKAEQAKALK